MTLGNYRIDILNTIQSALGGGDKKDDRRRAFLRAAGKRREAGGHNSRFRKEQRGLQRDPEKAPSLLNNLDQ